MKKILIVEDEKILRDMYNEKFSRENFEIVLATDADEGLEVAKKEKPDLILLDILLPDKNGIYFLEKMKADPQIANLRVVGFSNYDDPETRAEAKKLGIEDYLIKTNYTPKELVKKLREYFK